MNDLMIVLIYAGMIYFSLCILVLLVRGLKWTIMRQWK